MPPSLYTDISNKVINRSILLPNTRLYNNIWTYGTGRKRYSSVILSKKGLMKSVCLYYYTIIKTGKSISIYIYLIHCLLRHKRASPLNTKNDVIIATDGDKEILTSEGITTLASLNLNEVDEKDIDIFILTGERN